MHRITVVTNSISSDALGIGKPSSPVPALDAASDYSTGDEPSPNSLKSSISRPTKISNWRKRGLRHVPTSEVEPIQLDMSFLGRQDLPIQLVVDQPVPVENCYDDPDTQAFVDYFSLNSRSKSRNDSRGSNSRSKSRSRRSRSRKSGERAMQEEEKSSASVNNISNNGDAELGLNFADFDLYNSQDAATIEEASLTKPSSVTDTASSAAGNAEVSSASVAASRQQELEEKVCKNTGTLSVLSARVEDDAKVESPDSLSSDARETTTLTVGTDESVGEGIREGSQEENLRETVALVRCTSVIRMQYEGEMVSVSEQKANKIQECDWV